MRFLINFIIMTASDTIANKLEIALFEVEDELEKVRFKKDSKRNALRVWRLRTRSKKLLKDFMNTTYAQSQQWIQEIRNFEKRCRYIKSLIRQQWFLSHTF